MLPTTKSQRKRSSLFGDQVIDVENFWSKQKYDFPFTPDFEGETHIKASKSLLSEFSTRWLTYSYPILYLAGKKKSKEYKCLNLEVIPCKLYEYQLEKSKYPHKLVLRHSNTSFEFYFQDKSTLTLWISKLRGICLMCDLTSTYTIGNLVGRTNLYRIYWAHQKQDSKSYMARVYNLQNSATLEEDVHAQIEKQVIINEIKALRAIDHPNVTKLKEVHEFQGRVVMIFEFIGGSSLLKHIVSQGCLPEVETIYIMKTLLLTLQVLQKKKILHRNLKPENILFDYTASGLQLKLKSFGFSCSLDPNEQSTWNVASNICSKCGTPGYMAPELLNNKQNTLAGDIFSMGVILYTCLTGEPMFKGRTSEDIISKNLSVSFDRSSMKWLGLSEHAKDLILKMVHENPAKRPSIDTILRHPFFFQNHELTPNTFRPNYLNAEESIMRSKRSSIDDSMVKPELNSNMAVDKALQSLIVSPTYFELTSGEVPEVPEFYIDSLMSQDSEKIEEVKGAAARLDIPKLGIKLEMIKGSLSQLDPGEKTPSFKIKSFVGIVQDLAGETHGNEEEYSSDEIDESSPVRNFKKFNTFPKPEPAPLMTQKPIVQKFNTLSFKGDCIVESEVLLTGRKLPELPGLVRKKLGTKYSFIEDTIE